MKYVDKYSNTSSYDWLYSCKIAVDYLGGVRHTFHQYYNSHLNYAKMIWWSYFFALDRSNSYFYLDAIDDFSSLRLNEQFTKYHLTDDRHLALSYSHEVRNVYLLVCIWYCVSQTNFIRLKREFLMWCLRRKIKANFIFYFEYIGVIIQTHIKYFFRYKVWLKKKMPEGINQCCNSLINSTDKRPSYLHHAEVLDYSICWNENYMFMLNKPYSVENGKKEEKSQQYCIVRYKWV